MQNDREIDVEQMITEKPLKRRLKPERVMIDELADRALQDKKPCPNYVGNMCVVQKVNLQTLYEYSQYHEQEAASCTPTCWRLTYKCDERDFSEPKIMYIVMLNKGDTLPCLDWIVDLVCILTIEQVALNPQFKGEDSTFEYAYELEPLGVC